MTIPQIETPIDVVLSCAALVLMGFALGYVVTLARRWWKRWRDRAEERALERGRMNTAQWFRGRRPS